jgi:hypothetical protein
MQFGSAVLPSKVRGDTGPLRRASLPSAGCEAVESLLLRIEAGALVPGVVAWDLPADTVRKVL